MPILSNDRKYWELSREEIIKFYYSLDMERDTFLSSLEMLLASSIILRADSGETLAGIAGIREAKYKIIPAMFIVIKSEFQNKQIGNSLMSRLHNIVDDRYLFMILCVNKSNFKAIKLYKKYGYVVFREKGKDLYMIRSKDRLIIYCFIFISKIADRIPFNKRQSQNCKS